MKEWISAKEKLPTDIDKNLEHEDLLLIIKNNDPKYPKPSIFIGYYSGHEGWILNNYNEGLILPKDLTVIYWMHLPLLPKELL